MHPFSDLTGRVALVTGGGGDIGGASGMALAPAGADVIVVDLRQDAAEACAAAVRDLQCKSAVLVATAQTNVSRGFQNPPVRGPTRVRLARKQRT